MSIKAVPTLECSFCRKSAREVFKLIAGPTSFICDECIGLCADIIAEERAHQRITQDRKLLVTAEDAERLQWMRTWTCAKPDSPSEKGDGHG